MKPNEILACDDAARFRATEPIIPLGVLSRGPISTRVHVASGPPFPTQSSHHTVCGPIRLRD
jgi:hypothetical protein